MIDSSRLQWLIDLLLLPPPEPIKGKLVSIREEPYLESQHTIIVDEVTATRVIFRSYSMHSAI